MNTTLSKNTASIVAKVLANNKDVANAHVNGTSIPGNAVDDEKLPCEFCEAMIPMYKLHSHQVYFTLHIKSCPILPSQITRLNVSTAQM